MIELIQGDCLKVMRALPLPESVDLVFTDPPYADRYIYLYEKMAFESSRLLVPGGSLITLTGTYRLPETIAGMSKSLTYYWCCALLHLQSGHFDKYGIRQTWKPILWFTKGQGLHHRDIRDSVMPTGKEKVYNYMQQAEGWAEHFLSVLVPPGGLVLDPFIGSGTTAVVCNRLGIDCIGIDIDQQAIATAKRRLRDG
jgi:DNA modification methylase